MSKRKQTHVKKNVKVKRDTGNKGGIKSNESVNLYLKLVDGGYFTFRELRLVTDLRGFTVKTLNDAIYARYGYRNFKELKENKK